MFNHVGPPVEIPELESRTLEQGRFYKLDKVWVPSVTTVIGHQSKAGILEWQKRVGFHEAEKIRMKSSWRGTKYHNHVEKYLRNEDVEKTQKSEGLTNYLFRSARKDLDRITDIHLIEAPLYSSKLYLAGRVDCLAHFDNELAVIDFKTTKELKKPEWLENYFVQEMFYAAAYYELTDIPVTKLITIMVTPNGEVKVFDKRNKGDYICLLYTSPSPRDGLRSRKPSYA